MAKFKKKTEPASMKDALEKFDLKVFLKWVEKNVPLLYKEILEKPAEVQMATMCKLICNRTDMLDTKAYKKASKWLVQHNMQRRFF